MGGFMKDHVIISVLGSALADRLMVSDVYTTLVGWDIVMWVFWKNQNCKNYWKII